MKILDVTFLKSSSDKVLARADVHFDGFLLKGFKVIKDPKTNKEFVTPPSYKAGPYWRPLFRTDTVETWHEIQDRILEDYDKQQIEESMEETNKP